MKRSRVISLVAGTNKSSSTNRVHERNTRWDASLAAMINKSSTNRVHECNTRCRDSQANKTNETLAGHVTSGWAWDHQTFEYKRRQTVYMNETLTGRFGSRQDLQKFKTLVQWRQARDGNS